MNLFIGTFVSSIEGTKDVAEIIQELLWEEEGIQIKLASYYASRFNRVVDVLYRVLTFSGERIFFNVFSGKAFYFTALGSLIASWKKKKIIFTLHGGALHEFAAAHPALIKKVFSRAHHIQTPSKFLQQYFQQAGYSVSYLPNPIDLQKFPYNRTNIKPYSLLWVRAFSEIYQPQMAIEVLKKLKEKYPQTTLTMVGPDKGQLQAVKHLVEMYQLQHNVIFTGPVPNHTLSAYYQSHQIYLNTTQYESFGMALMEAAACGMPIVTNAVGEIPLLWQHQQQAMLCSSCTAHEMALHVQTLFESPALTEKLSVQAKELADTFAWQHIKPKWLALLTS